MPTVQHQVVKPQKLVNAAVGMLEQELVIPNLFQKQGVDQFKGAENDTISMKVEGILPFHDYAWRNDRSAPIQFDEYSERTIAVTFGGNVYSAVKLTDEQNDFDIDNWAKLLRPQSKAIARGLKELNKLQAELEKYANKAGNTASSALYEAGIHAAEGLVKGLQAQQGAIEKLMLKISDSMVNAIKKSLGIHSPSRVFAKLGGFVGRGFANGIESESDRVAKAVDAITAKPSRSDYASAARSVSAAVNGGLEGRTGSAVTKVLNYYAAPGSSISAEEDLFAAANRARMVGW